MRADAEREVAAPLRPHAAADAIAGLQHERCAVLQALRGDEPGDARADDDDVSVLGHAGMLRAHAGR